jgi:hypothetical protein
MTAVHAIMISQIDIAAHRVNGRASDGGLTFVRHRL